MRALAVALALAAAPALAEGPLERLAHRVPADVSSNVVLSDLKASAVEMEPLSCFHDQ